MWYDRYLFGVGGGRGSMVVIVVVFDYGRCVMVWRWEEIEVFLFG